ncbi:MAG: response regulator [Phycisphaerales bacterium JB064]
MSHTVLIVDDEPALTVALMTRLEANGYTVYHAINGLAGVEAAALHTPDAIVMDIRMPDISGFDAFERIRRLPGMTKVPVIFLSAHAQEGVKQQALDTGAAAFLSKPFEASDILNAISRSLEVDIDAHLEESSRDA